MLYASYLSQHSRLLLTPPTSHRAACPVPRALPQAVPLAFRCSPVSQPLHQPDPIRSDNLALVRTHSCLAMLGRYAGMATCLWANLHDCSPAPARHKQPSAQAAAVGAVEAEVIGYFEYDSHADEDVAGTSVQ